MSSPLNSHLENHADEMTCFLYLDGQLDSERAAELRNHSRACPQCGRLLGALQQETILLHDSLVEADEPLPARLLAPHLSDNVSWSWIGVAGAAAAAAYALWTSLVQPWFEQLDTMGFGNSNLLAMLVFSGAFWKGWGDMLNVIELFSMGSIGVLLFLLLRRNLRRLVSLSAVLAVVLAALVLPHTTAAAENQGHLDNYTLPESEVLHKDLVVGARTVRIEGTIEGDLIAYGQSIVVNGRVTGDIIAWAQEITVTGKVGGSLIVGCQRLRLSGGVDGNARVFAQTATLENSIAKNVTAWAQHLELLSPAKVNGSVMAFAASVTHEGSTAGDFAAFTGQGQIDGFIGGDSRFRGGNLIIGPNAQLAGKAGYKGDKQPDISPRAKLASPISVEIVKHRPNYLSGRFYRFAVLWTAAAFVFGLLLLFLMPDFFSQLVALGDRPGAPVGIGCLVLLVTPLAAVIVCITLVGIPIGITLLLLYIVALYSAQVFVGAWLGEKILGPGHGRSAQIARLAMGLVLLQVASYVPVLGAIVSAYTLVLGLGAITLITYERIRPATSRAVIA
jgi:cytoskeletal protein CcmA (bactofilin family)